MGVDKSLAKDKRLPVVEIVGAAAAVILLLMQMFWAQEVRPGLRHAIQIVTTATVTITALLLALKAVSKVKSGKDKPETDETKEVE